MSKEFTLRFLLTGEITSALTKAFGSGNKLMQEYAQQCAAANREFSKSADIKRIIELRKKLSDTSLIGSHTFGKERDELNRLENEYRTAGKSIDELIRKQHQLHQSGIGLKIDGINSKMQSWKNESMSALVQMGATVGPMISNAIKNAMAMDDVTAEIRKYAPDSLDKAGKQKFGEEYFQEVARLSTKYSSSFEDLAQMGVANMQAGIATTKKEFADLIEYQTQAQIAFDIGKGESGQMWADIQNRMKMDIEGTKQVFDLVNQFGNTRAAESKDIIAILQREGGTIKGLSALTQTQIAALATSFKEVSPSVEIASTSMSKFVSKLTAGAAATGAQKKAFKKLGLNPTEVAKAMVGSPEEAQKAIMDVFSRINGLAAHEKGALIGQLFGNESGIKAAVTTLAGKVDILKQNFATAGDEASYAGSMMEEYTNRANTVSDAIGIAKNQYRIFSGELGRIFLPYLKDGLHLIGEYVPKIMKWMEANKDTIAIIVKVGAAVGGMWVAYHAGRVAIASVISPLMSLYKAFSFVSALFATNPVVLALLAIVAAGVGLYLLITYWDEVTAAIKSVVEGFVGYLKDQWNLLVDNFWELVGMISGGLKSAWDSAWNALSSSFDSIWNGIKNAARMYVNAIIDVINLGIRGLNALGNVKMPDWVPGVGGQSLGINIPQIPKLAQGGIVSQPTMALIGEGRESEAVLPLSKLNSLLSSVQPQITINPAVQANMPKPQQAETLPLLDKLGKMISGWMRPSVTTETVTNNRTETRTENTTVQRPFDVGAIIKAITGIRLPDINLDAISKALAGFRLPEINMDAVSKVLGGFRLPEINLDGLKSIWDGTLGALFKNFRMPLLPDMAKVQVPVPQVPAPSFTMPQQESRPPEAIQQLNQTVQAKPVGSGEINLTFAPVIHVNGGDGDPYAKVKRGLDEGSRNLKEELERLMADQRRLSFV
jgi:TP901 family phage tail tape measure protein